MFSVLSLKCWKGHFCVMAVVLTEGPGAVVFSKNPVMYGFKSNARYSNAGRVAIGRITVQSMGVSGESFTLEYGGASLVFSLASNPDDSGLQLPMPAGADLNAWAGQLAVALSKNYYIDRDFVVTNVGNTIVLTSRVKSADFNISFSKSGAAFSYTQVQSAISKTTQPNFKLLCELFVKNSNGQFERYISSALETDDEGRAYWDISKQLSSALLVDRHDRPGMAAPVWEKSTRVIREFYITYSEMYGTVQKVRMVNRSAVSVGVFGGFSKVMLAERSFPSYFVRAGVNKWMSNIEGGRIIKVEQPCFSSIVNFVADYANVSAKVRIHYSDNTSVERVIQNLGAWKKHEKIICPLGVYQNSLHLVNEAKVIVEYEVWLDNAGVPVSEVQRFALNYRYEPYLRFLVFENSYGCYETFYCYGRKSSGYDLVQKRAKLVSNTPFKLDDGEELSYAINLTNEEQVNTGYMPKVAIRGFRDFFLSNEKFVYKNNRYYPVILNTNTIKEFEDGDNLHALEFGLVSAYNEELWSDGEDEEAHGYVPDLSGYIPAPPAVPENFDDRYYLKTLTYNRVEIDSMLNNLRTYVDGEVADMLEEQADLRVQLENKADRDHTHPDYVTLGEVADMISDLSLWAGEWVAVGAEDDGYVGGASVVYDNSIWTSLIEDNRSVPAVGAEWKLILHGGSVVIKDDTVSYEDTSATMNAVGRYPDMRIGGAVWSATNGVLWTRMSATEWRVDNITIK